MTVNSHLTSGRTSGPTTNRHYSTSVLLVGAARSTPTTRRGSVSRVQRLATQPTREVSDLGAAKQLNIDATEMLMTHPSEPSETSLPPPDPAERIKGRQTAPPAEPVLVSSRELSSLWWEAPWWVSNKDRTAGTFRHGAGRATIESRGRFVEGQVLEVRLIRRRVPVGNRVLGLAITAPFLALTDFAWLLGVFALLIAIEFALSVTRGRSVWLQLDLDTEVGRQNIAIHPSAAEQLFWPPAAREAVEEWASQLAAAGAVQRPTQPA